MLACNSTKKFAAFALVLVAWMGVQASSRESDERVSSIVDPWGNVATDVPASQLLQQQHDHGASFVDIIRNPAQLTSLEVKVSGQTAQHASESSAIHTMPMLSNNIESFPKFPKIPSISKEKAEKNHRELQRAKKAEDATSSLVTFLLFGFLFMDFTILGLLNSQDEQVRCYSYKLLSTVIVVFCALAVNSVQHKFLHWVLDYMHLHAYLDESLLCLFIGWFFSINVAGFYLRGSHEDRFAAMGLLEHVAAFVLMEMLAEKQEIYIESLEEESMGHEEKIVRVGSLRLDVLQLYIVFPLMTAAFIRLWQFATFFLRRHFAGKQTREDEEQARIAALEAAAAAAAQPPPPPALPPSAPAPPPQPASRLGFSGRGRSAVDGGRGVGFASGSSNTAEVAAAPAPEPEKPKPEPEAPPPKHNAVEAPPAEYMMLRNLAERCCGRSSEEALEPGVEDGPMKDSWQEEVGESEFTCSAIVVGFLMKQLIVYVCTAHPTPLDCTSDPVLCQLPPEQMLYLAIPMILFYLLGMWISLREKSEEVEEKNTVLESLQVHLSMTFSWILLHWCECFVCTLISNYSGEGSMLVASTVKKLFTAAALSPMLVLVIIFLDKMADRGLLDSTSAEASVNCVAFVVGVAWEKVFASAMSNMSSQLVPKRGSIHPIVPDLLLSIVLLYTMLPGWRKYLVPTASLPVPEREVEEEKSD